MTQRQLDKLTGWWKEKLRLQDWDVTVKLVNSYDELEPHSHANCHALVEAKTASIRLISPAVYADEIIPEYDVELTLVHELVHLHLEPLRKGPELALEQAVEALSRALVSLKRKKKV